MPSAMSPRFTIGVSRAFGRRPCREPVPFQEILPLALKNSVSGKGEKTADVACLQDMGVMLACLKKNDFNQPLCAKEINLFQECYKSHMDKSVKDATNKKNNLPHKELNKILARYPIV